MTPQQLSGAPPVHRDQQRRPWRASRQGLGAGTRPACRTKRGQDKRDHRESFGDGAKQWGFGVGGEGGCDSTSKMTPLGDCASPAALTSHTLYPGSHLRGPDRSERQSRQVPGPERRTWAPGCASPPPAPGRPPGWLARLGATLRAPAGCLPLQRRGRNCQPPAVPQHLRERGGWRAGGRTQGPAGRWVGSSFFTKSC